MKTISLFDLEAQMMSWDDLMAQAPAAAVKAAEESDAEGISTGGGKHEDIGFYVICTAGQGPCIVWTESDVEIHSVRDYVLGYTKNEQATSDA